MAASSGDPMHIGMLWHPNQAYAERREPDILGIPWCDLPLEVRRAWWQATSYGQHEPSPEFMASLPALRASAESKPRETKHEIASDIAAAQKLLERAPLPPCEQCLRPHSPCRLRCLRSMGVTGRPEPETARRNLSSI
jgi:hypothetical protein